MDSSVLAVLAATASFFVVTLVFAVVFGFCKRSSQQGIATRTQRRTQPTYELSSIGIGESASFDPSLNQISMTELVRATGNFSTDRIIGDGSFGLVYKAQLSNGVTVAVKKLSKDAFQGFREFRAEMETLGRLRHGNIVKILGYCATGADRVLIYEFVEKGSLDQWLHDTSEDYMLETASSSKERSPLSWETRTKIIKGVANGLLYLHSLETPIIHRDIKASNILLDSKFEPHIADFGLARRIEGSHSHVSTQFAGTMGYMPPEYKDGVTVVTVKADVYSFGILMIEIATGRRPNLPVKEGDGKVIGLMEWACKMVENNSFLEMVDLCVPRDGLKEDEVREFFRVACLCTSEISGDRPSMDDVVELLEGIP